MTGSMYITAAVTQIVAALMLAAGFLLTDWSIPVFLAVALPLMFAFCWFFLPRSMGLWVGVEYMVDVSNEEEWVEPRG